MVVTGIGVEAAERDDGVHRGDAEQAPSREPMLATARDPETRDEREPDEEGESPQVSESADGRDRRASPWSTPRHGPRIGRPPARRRPDPHRVGRARRAGTRRVDDQRRQHRKDARSERCVEQRPAGCDDEEEHAHPRRGERRQEEQRRDRSGVSGRPLDEEERPHTEQHGADEAGLKGPEEILGTGPEEQQRNRDQRRHRGPHTTPHQRVCPRDGDQMEDDDLRQVRKVGVQADEMEREAVESQREGRPVLVHGPQVVHQPAVERDRAPLVLPESQRAAQVEKDGATRERDDHERDVRAERT